MMMNNIDEYLNQIELLKQALLFYANVDNYKQTHIIDNKLFSYVEMDSGIQAKFALKQLENLKNINEIDYSELGIDAVDYLSNELKKQITELKQINLFDNENTD